MLGLILNNLDKYPLDAVAHYELEIDWGWVKDVIDEMEQKCKDAGIPFYRIKPRDSWYDLKKLYNFPSRVMRWCNSKYKMDAERQMVAWIESQDCRPVAYIGFCADETSRFKYQIGEWEKCDVCYPLAEEGIEEKTILEWARGQKIFQGWYMHFERQGCKLCPMVTRKELAYMLKYEPDTYAYYAQCVLEYEEHFQRNYFAKYYWHDVDRIVRTKWIPILEDEENQYNFFDDIYGMNNDVHV